MNAQCDKLVKIVGRTSTVACSVNLVRPITVQFITLSVHLCQTEFTTRYEDRRAVASFSGDTNFITIHANISSIRSSHFDRTPTCDRHRHWHTDTGRQLIPCKHSVVQVKTDNISFYRRRSAQRAISVKILSTAAQLDKQVVQQIHNKSK